METQGRTFAVATAVGATLAWVAMPALGATAETRHSKKPRHVEFSPGETTRTLRGAVSNGRDLFIVRAAEGQELTVKLASTDPSLAFDIAETATREAPEADPKPIGRTEWTGKLKKPADYMISVQRASSNAASKNRSRYSLTVSLVGAGKQAAAATGPSKSVTYSCEGGKEIVAHFTTGDAPQAQVVLGDQSWTLPLVPAGSGSQYAKDATIFWTKGDEATFESSAYNGKCLVRNAAVSVAGISANEWTLEALSKERIVTPLPKDVVVTALFKDGRVTGRGGCNNYFGSYTATGDEITIGDMGATRMMCPHLEFETLYLEVLGKARNVNIGATGLLLSSPTGSLAFVKK